ncbi:biotin--[acetyl-CoA-carboxylase] ligase [Microbacterium sp. ZXX196]|uniref:biotin--[acetyl-CoA-carboxylase] ligase n=1 Tax=Microbacterium sp. ZXX196 TaxID=2609291 RepID=UPI0012B887F3|nr:biotin--[acetyl-CoA-carboxylase] ligase [Microbacterium sp. ZXX196]MTE22719.1 biotin--[acetyl-CoA-carboxylase] ligase [Microbacterium sp. ZXX196]
MWTLARAVSPRIEEVPSTGSTNEDLAERIRAGEAWPHLGAYLTRDQRGGRGRLGRAWRAPAGSSLAISVALDARRIPPERRGWIPLVAGVAMRDAASRQLPAPAGVKWPNDVLVGERKLCGILAEVAGPAIVVGSGVNTRMRQDERPVPTATSFAMEGVRVDEDRLLADYLGRLRELSARLVRASVREVVREACVTLGREVTAHLPGGDTVTGVASDIDEDGRLVLLAPGPRAIAAGDVVHVRPAQTGSA